MKLHASGRPLAGQGWELSVIARGREGCLEHQRSLPLAALTDSYLDSILQQSETTWLIGWGPSAGVDSPRSARRGDTGTPDRTPLIGDPLIKGYVFSSHMFCHTERCPTTCWQTASATPGRERIY